jgi:hypothetical protein
MQKNPDKTHRRWRASSVFHRCSISVHHVLCFRNRCVKPNVNPHFSRVLCI